MWHAHYQCGIAGGAAVCGDNALHHESSSGAANEPPTAVLLLGTLGAAAPLGYFALRSARPTADLELEGAGGIFNVSGNLEA